MTSRVDEIDWFEAAVLCWFNSSLVDEDAFNQLLQALGADIKPSELGQLKIAVGVASLQIAPSRHKKREVIKKCDAAVKAASRFIAEARAMREVLGYCFGHLNPGNQNQLIHTFPDIMHSVEKFADIVVGLREDCEN